ncbi:ferredoxin [Albimonas sp. CAU 1670]|uniref:ferredoxin n=1 Tax=Albimonas sp. CAU 1670 TaxID=3032599 RepID=UPI0023D98B68|nr:ferredoxin [Albimonas sp. CAU 1670]MDF2231345.1 ferredoxin [Albimonas sp. CAU 1670]
MTPPRWEAIASAAAGEGLRAAPFALAGDEGAPGAPRARFGALLAADAEAWARFRAAPEAQDGGPDPLDRWSARVAGALAARFGARAVLPSDGPPYAPFPAWALRAEPVWPSRLGPLLHACRGLWVSWRAALLFEAVEGAPPPPARGPNPCGACPAPCLRACPVDAFAETPQGPRYDVPACAAHLETPQGAPCREGGCLARHACPVGRAAAHPPERAAFHMAAFLRARRAERAAVESGAGPGG